MFSLDQYPEQTSPLIVVLAVCVITADPGESLQTAFAVVNGRDHDVGPELRAILAHTPVLVAALAARTAWASSRPDFPA